MHCELCIEPVSSDDAILSVDEESIVCSTCVSDIALNMTVTRGEFRE